MKATFLKNSQETGGGGRETKQNETDPRNNDKGMEKIKASKKVKKQKQIKQIKGQLTLKQLLLRTNNVGKQKNENGQQQKTETERTDEKTERRETENNDNSTSKQILKGVKQIENRGIEQSRAEQLVLDFLNDDNERRLLYVSFWT